MSATQPVILISGSANNSASVQAMATRVMASGAQPVIVTDHMERVGDKDAAHVRAIVQADLANADAVIILGNQHDIDPARYGQPANEHTDVETKTPEGRARAAYEFALVEETLKEKKPYLGVCGGMQRLNVLLGGTLHQDVPSLVGNTLHDQRTHDMPPYIPVEFVQTMEGSTLASIAEGVPGVYVPAHGILPSHVTMQNSMHHQAVDKTGDGLRVAAHSLEVDKPQLHIVEAIEADPNGRFGGQFVMGLQWHPEFGDSVLSHQVIKRVVEEAREKAREKVVEHGPHDRPRDGQWAVHVRQQQAATREAGKGQLTIP